MNRSLRFCMVTTFYPPYNFGGDGIFVSRLSNELAERGHHVQIVHCIDSFKALARTEPIAPCRPRERIVVHSLRSPLGPASPILTHLTGRPYLKQRRLNRILSQPFDVIHYHNISLIGGPAILRMGSAIKLYTMHEYWLLCPTHLLYRFMKANCRHRSCFRCSLSYKRPPQLWRHPARIYEALEHVDAFIAPSRFCKEKHLETYPNLPIVHLPNFAPQPSIAVEETDQTVSPLSEAPYFLFVGRLEKVKGLQTLIPVFKKSPEANLRVAGAGGFLAQLTHLARGCENIWFLGHVNPDDLHRLYRNAVAVILPYQTYEVFPQVMIESFRAGTPVIARSGGAMIELVLESRGGCTYTTDEELLGHMRNFLADRKLRNELGRNGFLAYRDKWTPESHMRQYFQLISLLEAGRENLKQLSSWSKT